MVNDRTKLHFARFEFKYIMPTALRDEVEKELGYFLELDPFVSATPDRKYFVRSLYYDDPEYTCFFDKVEGLRSRSKFRLRTYTKDPSVDAPAFLEIKGRYNNLVFKHRVPITGGGEWRSDESSKLAQHILDNTKVGDPVRTQFEYELLRKQLQPVALIDYKRRPYVSKYDPEFRLTFDEQLQGIIATGLFPSSWARSRALLPGYTVIEVKFRYHMPSWFHRIIQAYELRRVSISKICRGMEVLEIAEDVS
jgi:hypothetical protein